MILQNMKSYVGWSLAAAMFVAGLSNAAEAQNRGVGTVIGIGAGLLLLNEAAKAMQQQPQRPQNRPSGGSGNKEDAPSRKSAEQRLQEVKAYAAAFEEARELDRSRRQEAERDVDGAVTLFVGALKEQHRQNKSGRDAEIRSSFSINQVTEGEVRRILDEAYNVGRLFEFEKLAGEMWTRDRLMVRVLRVSERELAAYFRGVGVRGTSKDDLRAIFEQAAKRVYAQAVELAEIIGVSYSFDRFIRTIYENSDDVPQSLWTMGADGHYERLVSSTIDTIPREVFVANQGDQSIAGDPLGLERHFLFRFRARRAVYDCISTNYRDIVHGNGGAQTIEASARAKSSSGGTGAPPAETEASLVETPIAWRRTQEFTGRMCQTMLTQVATEAKDGRLAPKPARWDSSLGDAQWKPTRQLGGAAQNFPTGLQ
jgi:hypothetical protein